jgi:hypothetical protein
MLYAMVFEKFFFGEAVFFLLVCWASWMTGRSVARVWGTLATCLMYAVPLALGSRFLHFALYEGPFRSPVHFLSDLAILAVIAVVAYRYTLTGKMVSQYNWLYERASPLSWRSRT